MESKEDLAAKGWIIMEEAHEFDDEDRYREALSVFMKAAELGSTDAMFALGELYSGGLGLRKNDQEAEKWYRKAAEKGQLDAMWCLGLSLQAAGNLIEACAWWSILEDQAAESMADGFTTCREELTTEDLQRAHEMAVEFKKTIESSGHAYSAVLFGLKDVSRKHPVCEEEPSEKDKDKRADMGINRFHQAARQGNLKEVRRFLSAGYDVDSRNQSGDTALILAAENGRIETVRHLLDAGADVHAFSPHGDTALSHASWKQHIELINLLHDRGADPNTKQYGATLLFQAAQANRLESVKALLAGGADPNAKQLKEFDPPLVAAAANGYAAVVRELLRAGAKITAAGKYALMKAAANGHLETVQVLLTEGKMEADPRPDNGKYPDQSALQLAARNGHENVVQLLLEHGADMEFTSDNAWATALGLACQKGHLIVVTKLLEKGANPNGLGPRPNYSTKTPIFLATDRHSTGRVDIVKALIENGADPNQEGVGTLITQINALMNAAANNYLEIAQFLLARPEVSIDTVPGNEDGYTPTIFAAANGHFDMVKLLVENGADIRHVCLSGGDGETALYQAVKNGHYEIAAYLLDKGAEPRIADVSRLDENWIRDFEARYNLYANLVRTKWAQLNDYPPSASGFRVEKKKKGLETLLQFEAEPQEISKWLNNSPSTAGLDPEVAKDGTLRYKIWPTIETAESIELFLSNNGRTVKIRAQFK